MKKIRLKLYNAIIVTSVFFMGLLSHKTKKKLIAILAKLILKHADKTRKRAFTNITNALPHLTNDEAEKLMHLSYQHIILGILDIFWLKKRTLHFEIDETSQAILNADKGVSLATLHLSCHEIMPYAIQQLTQRSTTLSNIPDYITCGEKQYSSLGIHGIHKKDPNAFFKLLQAIKQQQVVTLHSDNYAKDIAINFFNQGTWAPAGCAMLSAYGKTPLLIGYALLQADGSYKIYIETLFEKPIDTTKTAIADAVVQVNQRFEQIIQQHPEQWYWSYKRWRKP